MRHIIPQFVESGILSLPTLLDDATQGALPAWVAARRGLVAGRCGLVRGQASLAVWRRHRPTCDPAACLLSMVFEFHHLKLPGAIAHPTQKPCLEDVLLLWGGCALWPGAHS